MVLRPFDGPQRRAGSGALPAAAAAAAVLLLPALAHERVASPRPVLDAAAPEAPGGGAGIVLLAGGDVTLGYHLPEFFQELRGRGIVDAATLRNYPFHNLVPWIRQADLFLVNLEGTFTTGGIPLEKNFNFRADPADVEILQAAGVDVVSLANNHAFDFGAEGLAQTRATLLAAGIAAFGAGRDLLEARRPAILERAGIRVGFLGYLHLGDHSIEPPEMFATLDKPGVSGTHEDLPTLLQWVRDDVAALALRVDRVVVSFHWGREGRNLTEPYQRRLARQAADAGADLIIGHHPHSLQGVERVGEALVAYSLGNLVFAGNWSPARKEAALLRVRLQPAGARGAPQGHFVPISVDRQPELPFQPYVLDGAEACRVRHLLYCYAGATAEGECEARLNAEPEVTGREAIPAPGVPVAPPHADGRPR